MFNQIFVKVCFYAVITQGHFNHKWLIGVTICISILLVLCPFLHFYLMGWLSKRGENRRADYPRKGKIIGKLGKR
jgi:NhaP-type Na+/H+ or K+/H+ antiporter